MFECTLPPLLVTNASHCSTCTGGSNSSLDSPNTDVLLSDNSPSSLEDTYSLSSASSPDPGASDSIFLSLSATRCKEPMKRRRHKVIPVYHHYVMSQNVLTVQAPARQETVVKDLLKESEVAVDHVINTSSLTFEPTNFWEGGQNFDYPLQSAGSCSSYSSLPPLSEDRFPECDPVNVSDHSMVSTSNHSFGYLQPPCYDSHFMYPRSGCDVGNPLNSVTAVSREMGNSPHVSSISSCDPSNNVSITSSCGMGNTLNTTITSPCNMGNPFESAFPPQEQYSYGTSSSENYHHPTTSYCPYPPVSSIL